ncbi:MAG: M24 family metallopeptidase [Lentisphaeria bacterium]|nr:M24 family metallopeptidase [Lentisphaeria bacterium]
MDKKALLLLGDGSNVTDMRYASGFSAPDNFLYMECGTRKICAVSALEYNRALSSVIPGVEVRRTNMSHLETIKELCSLCEVNTVVVPDSFPVGMAEKIKEAGINLEISEARLYPRREFKTLREVQKITASLRAAEAGCRRAIEVLRESDISRERTLVWQGKPLTSEILRAEIDCTMLRLGMIAEDTICAGGLQAAQPHNTGSGVLPADYPIVLDIFPRSAATGYWGDLTRTVVKGTPSDFMRKAYDAVFEAREFTKECIRPGAIPSEIHKCAENILAKRGFTTGCSDKGDYGFFHGLGHGVGLDIHEFPRLNPRTHTPLKPGIVVTDEPGLYYPDKGGIRLEDMIYLNEEGKAVTLTEIEDQFIIE